MTTITISSNISAKKNTTLSTNMNGETVILDISSGKYYGLDGVGADVWNLIQDSQSVDSVKDALLEMYDIEAQQCESDLVTLLQSLYEAELIEVK